MKKEKLFEKSCLIVTWVIRLIIVLTAVIRMMMHQYDTLFILVITLVITFYRPILKKWFKIELPTLLDFSIILFIFGTQYLGSAMDVYGKWHAWDTILHGLSGILFFYIGLTLLEEVRKKMGGEKIHPLIQILFGFFFVLAVGVVWEIFEFIADRYLGANMQRAIGEQGQNAILDTMTDLIAAFIGASVTCIYQAIAYRRRKKEGNVK